MAAGAVDEDAVLDRARGVLRGQGQRMTAPRRAVLLALAARGGHVGADQVAADVALAGVHRSSVYRTLDALTRLGAVQHVHLGHGATAYHLVEAHHPHAQCRSCRAVVDLPVDLLEPLVPALAARTGFTLDPSHVALSGTCASCARGDAEGDAALTPTGSPARRRPEPWAPPGPVAAGGAPAGRRSTR